ncbi:hypothetical protein [Actinoplanes sp. N902-109]|nr:hypothetical protein [Actinoplanes sp. N902-109]AGL15666.1 hypothetical protein L083_2156 [Actinoplanes sp. N902-109]
MGVRDADGFGAAVGVRGEEGTGRGAEVARVGDGTGAAVAARLADGDG